jgi:hypothetical protein
VFCFSFTNPGRRELREREKEKEKKAVDWLGLSDPAPSCSQLVNRQAGWQQLPDPAPGCYVLYKVSLRSVNEYFVPLCVSGILVGRKSSIIRSLLPQKSGVIV